MNHRLSTIVLAALIATLMLSACGGGGPAPTPTPAAETITVEAREIPSFSFTPNTFSAKVGEELTFTIANKGDLEHNFVVFDPSGKELARTTIAVGASASVKVAPSAAGEYSIVCDVPGHKEAGMVAALTVSP